VNPRHWQVELTPTASRDLDGLSDNLREDLIDEILSLEEDPLPEGHMPLRGFRDHYRIKAGRNQRIIYRIVERQRRILILHVRPRGKAYSGFSKWLR
jgi:mRNA-degrading endonuclease RelE of RelBE toxin-antitoxin system